MDSDGNIAQKQTLRQLIDLKQDVMDVVEDAETIREQEVRGEGGSVNGYRAKINGSIRPFLRELKAIRGNFEDEEPDTDYWEDVHIGQHTLPDNRVVEIDGLNDLISLPHPFTVETTESEPGYGGGDTDAVTDYYLPPRIYVEGYYLAVEWMSEVGLMPDETTTPEPDENPVDPGGRFDE